VAAKTNLTVWMKDGTHPTVEGYLVAPGLGVHRCILGDGTLGTDWNVIHTLTGARICGSFPTRRDAIMAAEQFALLADWEGDGFELLKVFAREVIRIRMQILWNSETAHDKRRAKATADYQEGLFR
jgi:hypothetical protein